MVISGRQPVSAGRCPPSAVRRRPSGSAAAASASNSLSLEDYKCINDDKGNDTGSRRGSESFLHSLYSASTASIEANSACTKGRPSWPFPFSASAVLQLKTSKDWCFPIPLATWVKASRFLPLESPEPERRAAAVRLAGRSATAQAESSSSAPALQRRQRQQALRLRQRLSGPRQALQLRLQVGQAW